MRLGSAAIAALLLVWAAILPGCGDEQSTAAGVEKGSIRTTQGTTTKAHAAASKAATGEPAARECRSSLGDFLDSMESLNNSLAVGLSYEDYLSAVNQVRGTYAPIEADQLPLLCLTQVASPAEGALNTYIEAANTWGDCLATPSCDPESIEPQLQRKWGVASEQISEAQDNLQDLQ
jgi:hypothetical protein